MRQVSRYESPSQKRKRHRRNALISIASVVAVLFLLPIIGKRLNAPYDLNLFEFVRQSINTATAPFLTPVQTSEEPSPAITDGSSGNATGASKATASPKPGSDEEEAKETVEASPSPEISLGSVDIRQKYSIEMTLSEDWSKLDCVQQIDYTNPSKESLDAIPLRVFDAKSVPSSGSTDENGNDAQPNKLNFSRVIIDGQSCSYVFDESDPSVVWIQLPSHLETEQSARMTLAYTCDIAENSSNFGRGSRSVRLSNFYPVASSYGSNGWILERPSKADIPWYQPKADYKVTLRLSEHDYDSTVSAHTGAAVQKGERSWEFEVSNARDFAIVVSPERRHSTEQFDDINFSVETSRTSHGRYILRSAQPIMQYLGQALSPYSGNLSIYEADIDNSLSAHSGLILFQMPSDSEGAELDYHLAYSMAKQWFGVEIAGDKNANALNDLLCHYLAASYTIQTYGDETATWAYSKSAEAKKLADIASSLPAGQFDAAMREYRLNASGRYATAEMMTAGLDQTAADSLTKLIKDYSNKLFG